MSKPSIEKTENGWREISTENIVVEKMSHKPFMSVRQWIDGNKKLGLTRGRTACDRCKRKWETLEGNVWVAFTNKGNRMVCDDCHDELMDAALKGE